MVASKDTRIFTGSGQGLTFSLRDDRVCVPCLNALKFLQWGCKNGGRGRKPKARRRVARRKASGALLGARMSESKMDPQMGALYALI